MSRVICSLKMRIRVLPLKEEKEVLRQMRALGVDREGIKIMSSKASFAALKIENITAILANVLKQEMLSLGAELAVPREVITGKLKHSDCLALATFAQYGLLVKKLKRQPWGLDKIGEEIDAALKNISRRYWRIKAGRFNLEIGRKTLLMGILNITPDSFSDGGVFLNPIRAIEQALVLVRDGADIIDMGGESTRPGAKTVSLKEELKRVIPVIKVLSKRLKVPISIDTRKSEVARQAIEAGASLVNDVSGLRYDPKMKKVLSYYKVPAVIMHMRGVPFTMQRNPHYRSVFSEIIAYLERSINMAVEAGVSCDNIIVDPGIGFGKDVEHNLAILRNLSELKVLGRPILVGTSRKSFIGKVLDLEVGERLYGSIASACLAVINGANILRVHDVKQVRQAASIVDAIIKSEILN
jgi:dihydropteroate synthase